MSGKNGKQFDLAKPGDPLVTRDGQILEEDTKGVFRRVEGTEGFNPTYYRAEEQRVLSDLPAPPRAMNLVGVVLLYTLWGVGDAEIAEVLSTNVTDVKAVRQSAAYADSFKRVNDELITANSVSIENRVAGYANDMLTAVADIALHGDKENNRLKAAVNILDRNDKKDRVVNPMNELKITITQGENEKLGIDIGM